MVSSSEDGLARSVPTDLLSGSVGAGDGVVVVATRDDPTEATERVTGTVDGLSPSSLSVVATAAEAGTDRPASVHCVGPDPAPDALSAAVEAGYDALDADRVHLLFDAIGGTVTRDRERVYQRAHDLAMAVGTEPGAALFTVDASAFERAFVDRLTHLFDVDVRLRRDGGECQACWTTLTGASDGWESLSEVEFPRMVTV